MAKNYKIKVKVEIVESEPETGEDPVQTEAGQCEWVITSGQAMSIDQYEQALQRTNYPALRAALAEHLTELSKKSDSRRSGWAGGAGQKVSGGWRGGPT